MRVLITGGAGFIGSNFVRYLLNGTADVVVVNLDLLTYAGSQRNLTELPGADRYTFVRGDISDGRLVRQLLTEHGIDTVVHLAAESHVDRSIDRPAAFIQTNVVGTFTLLEAARTVWGDNYDGCRFLHVSTDEVFGTLGENGPAFTEATAYAPNSPYAASKAASDHLARAYFKTYGLPTLSTNCSNNHGPYQHPEKLIPRMIVSALADEPLPVYGDGRQIRDWLFVEDHCAALDAVLRRGRLGETYNFGGSGEKRNLELVQTICDLLDDLRPRSDGRSYREQITHVADRPGHDRRYAIDSSKAHGELGWTPRVSFEVGLQETIAWYLDHPDWITAVMNQNDPRRLDPDRVECKEIRTP